MNDAVTIEKMPELEKLLSTNPDMKRLLRKLVSQVLRRAKTELSKNARSGLNIKDDPRKAVSAVRAMVYKRLLGGNVSILQKRNAGSTRVLMPRAGSRGQSKRTQQLSSYWGADRGFILRFLNAGTSDRSVKGLNGRTGFRSGERVGKRVYVSGGTGRNGYRGSISGRNWFAGASQQQLDIVSKEFCNIIDKEITNMKL